MTDIELNGKCQAIDTTARTFTIKDTGGAIHPFKWGAGPLDDVMKKWKAGYYLTVKYDTDTHAIKNVSYWQEGKDQFPKQQTGGQFAPRKPRVTISATVNLQNYENIKVEVESTSSEESTKILVDTLNTFARNPAYSATRELIDSYLVRVLNQKAGGK